MFKDDGNIREDNLPGWLRKHTGKPGKRWLLGKLAGRKEETAEQKEAESRRKNGNDREV